MAILKADVLTFVNNVLKEAFTDIDSEILACLADMSKYNFLTDTATDTLTVTDESVALQSDFRQEVSIIPSLNDVNSPPLKPYSGGYKELKDMMGSGITGTPAYYVIYDGKIYFDVAVSSAYVITTEYYKYHAKDADTIEFSEDFTNAINFGAAYYAALFRKKTSYIEIWRPIYKEEKAKMVITIPEQPHIVRG